MSQEPWNDEIYKSDEKSRKSRAGKNGAASKVFTILAVVFLIIIAAITITAIYLSSGGSNTDSSKEFYNPNTSESSQTSTTEVQTTTEAIPATTEEKPQPPQTEPGATLTVEAGEGMASIAARAGISISELERLNPEKMTGPGGTWWANPGDVVRIK